MPAGFAPIAAWINGIDPADECTPGALYFARSPNVFPPSSNPRLTAAQNVLLATEPIM
jgi:hypothetical protein